jgi:hypothetical protein
VTDQADPAESLEAEPGSLPAEDVPVAVRSARRRRRRQRAPGLIVAALLVGAGLFLALRGMQQVVARAPATPVPTPTAIASAAPASIETPTQTLPPTPMPTSSPLILEP